MNESPPAHDDTVRRYREAADWLLRLDGEKLSEEELAEWLRWSQQDGENLRAFARVQADWKDVDALRLAGPPPAAPRPSRLVSSRRWGLAATLAALAVLLGVASWSPLRAWLGRGDARDIVAATSNETTSLPDGSVLTLRAQAAVRMSFDASQRRLELAEDGAAYFEVHHDPIRPFVVEAGDLTIQAIGTAFDVRRESGETWVSVEEGKVRISTKRGTAVPADGVSEWIASAGERFEFKPAAHHAALSRHSVADAHRWREGEFAYDKVALETVLRDINRYSTRKIRTADEAAARIPYTGTVFVRSIDDWLRALTSRYPVRAVAAADGDVVLERVASR